MRKLLIFAGLVISLAVNGQTGGRFCIPFDSTFHFLRPGNLNLWVQGGVLTMGESRDWRFGQQMSMNLHYVPVRYLQTGINLTKRLPAENGVSFWKSYELALFARYSFLRMDCPKMGVYAHTGYTNVVQVRKVDNGKTNEWMPYAGIGMYKDLGRAFSLQLENELYFNRRPDQISVNLVWKFINCKF